NVAAEAGNPGGGAVGGVAQPPSAGSAAFDSAYVSAYADWIQQLTPSFISDATAIAQADADDQDALAEAAQNADEAGAAANVKFVNSDAPAAADEAIALATADDGYATSVVTNLDATANTLAAADAAWMNGVAAADASFIANTAGADLDEQILSVGGTPPGAKPPVQEQADALLWLNQGRADADLTLITAQAGAGSQFSQLDAGNWQTMIGGEASAINAFSHADDAAVAGENDDIAVATGALIQAVALADQNQANSDATAADNFTVSEANQTAVEWNDLVGWASPTTANPAGQPGQPWLSFEAQQAQLLAQWQQTAAGDDEQQVSTVGQDEVAYANDDATQFV